MCAGVDRNIYALWAEFFNNIYDIRITARVCDIAGVIMVPGVQEVNQLTMSTW